MCSRRAYLGYFSVARAGLNLCSVIEQIELQGRLGKISQ